MKAKVIFQKCIQDSQEFGSDDEHMVSRIFLSIMAGEKKHDVIADIKQTVGSNFVDAPLEVSFKDYKGPSNYIALQAEVEKYYRESFGEQGHAIKFGGGSQIRMDHNTVIRQKIVEIEVSSQGGEAW